MKKSLLALAVAAAAAASTVNAATVYDKDGSSIDVYGRVMAVFYSQDYNGNNSNTASNDGNFNSSSRLGLNFRSEINQYVAAVAKVEWEMAAEDGTTSNRYTWVGADFGQFGLLKVGKFEDAVKYVVSTTDIFEDAGCNGQLDNDDRRDGMVMYSWSGWGFDVNLSYGTAKDDQQVDGAFWSSSNNGSTALAATNDKEKVDIDQSWGVSLGYTTPEVLFGPISIRVGYAGAEFQHTGDYDGTLSSPTESPYFANPYNQYEQWAASLTWGNLSRGLYVSALFQNRNFELSQVNPPIGGRFNASEYDVTGAEFVIAYAFENGITLMGGYNWMEVDYDTIAGTSDGRATDAASSVIPVLVQWQFNPNLKVWVEGRFDAGTDDAYAALTNYVYAHNDENVFAVGAKYTF